MSTATNAVQRALLQLHYTVPREVLNETFLNNENSYREESYSLDDKIKELVIHRRVNIDADLVGGNLVFIYIGDLFTEYVNPYTAIVRIPKSKTAGKTIISVLSVYNILEVGMATPGAANPFIENNLVLAGNAMMNAMASAPAIISAYLELIGENTVLIRQNTTLTNMNFIRCVLSNNEDMSNLQLRSIPHYCKLVELAVKSYIYNYWVVKIGMGFLVGGKELGPFKDVVESYSDAEQQYQEYLNNVWGAVAFMNSNENYVEYSFMLHIVEILYANFFNCWNLSIG